jgi:hypothetical protein
MITTDKYTKVVLSIIALALCTIVYQNASIIPEAKADHTNFSRLSQIPVNDDGSINVKLLTSDMDVNIKSLGGNSIYGSLPINLKDFGGTSVSSYGLPVNIYAVGGSSIYSAVPVKNSN